MLARWLVFFILFSPVVLYATQENDIELFEFLAMYDEKDIYFIDSEMDDKNISSEDISKNENLINKKVSKSDADE